METPTWQWNTYGDTTNMIFGLVFARLNMDDVGHFLGMFENEVRLYLQRSKSNYIRK